MNADPSSPSPPSSDAYYACGPEGERGWRFWPIIPLAFLGGFLLLVAVAWGFGATGWWSGPAPFFWPLFPLGIFLFVLVLFVTLRFAGWGRAWGGRRYWSGVSSAEEILRQRYARGEISEQEYRERLQVLGSSARA
jgi:putative membrane protein